jgi:hypothetical protein
MSDLLPKFISLIARKLGETEAEPIVQIERIVERLGPDRAAQLVQDALAIDRAGGLLIRDGSRRRSVGGVFFVLARGACSRADSRYIWPIPYQPLERPKRPYQVGRFSTRATSKSDGWAENPLICANNR